MESRKMTMTRRFERFERVFFLLFSLRLNGEGFGWFQGPGKPTINRKRGSGMDPMKRTRFRFDSFRFDSSSASFRFDSFHLNLPLRIFRFEGRPLAWLQKRRSRQSTGRRVWNGSGMEDSIPKGRIPLPQEDSDGRGFGDAPTRGVLKADHATEAYGGLQAGRKATGSLQPPWKRLRSLHGGRIRIQSARTLPILPILHSSSLV
jgi:hypothetical protein